MRVSGCIMIALGLIGLLVSFGMDTSVSNGLAGRVENIGLLSRQSNGLVASGLLFMTGCILVGLAAVRDAVERLGPRITANAHHASPPIPFFGGSPTPASSSHGAHTALARSAEGILVGARVRHPSFGEGVVEAVEGETATVLFDRREKPEPMNTAYLTVLERAAP